MGEKRKDKEKWSPNFHSFIKVALTKNPKKRPSADKLLEHPFLLGDFNKKYGKDLLDLYLNGPMLARQEDDDDEPVSVLFFVFGIRYPKVVRKNDLKLSLYETVLNFKN